MTSATAVGAAFAPTVDTAAAATTAPATTPAVKAPPASGLWTADATTDVIRAVFAYRSGTTYAIKAVKGSTTRKGVCTRVDATVRCTVKAPTGRWRVTVTPKVNGKPGKAIIRTIRT
jgi:hypothetical protein